MRILTLAALAVLICAGCSEHERATFGSAARSMPAFQPYQFNPGPPIWTGSTGILSPTPSTMPPR